MSEFFVHKFDMSIASNESQTRIRVCRGLNKFNPDRTHSKCGAENQEIFVNDWDEFNAVYHSTPHELGDRPDVKDVIICKLCWKFLFKIHNFCRKESMKHKKILSYGIISIVSYFLGTYNITV